MRAVAVGAAFVGHGVDAKAVLGGKWLEITRIIGDIIGIGHHHAAACLIRHHHLHRTSLRATVRGVSSASHWRMERRARSRMLENSSGIGRKGRLAMAGGMLGVLGAADENVNKI